jgi:signal transduction histidine kinase/ligand-binding sensor domain-containing protein/AraC-like DNA-binding protein
MPTPWWTIAIAFLPAILQGQANSRVAEHEGTAAGFVLESWTVADGLPVNSITKIIQSRSGYLWLGTFDGLVRFDGVRFTVFNVGNSDGLPTNRIIDLKEVENGALLLTTELGQFVRFNDRKFTLLPETPPAAVPPSEIRSIRTADGKTWMTNGREIFLDGRLAFRRPQSTGFSGTITTIAADHEGSLWFATVAGGLHQIKPAVFTMFGLREGRGESNVYSVTPASAGGVWAGTWGANVVSHIDSGRISSFSGQNGIQFGVSALHEDAQHRLMIGDLRCEMPGANCHLLGPDNITVRAIQEDADGTLWLGSDNGLFKFVANKWQSFASVAGSPKGAVRAFARARDGSLWMATNGEGVIRFADSRFTRITTSDGLPMNLVRALYVDKDGWLWIGTEGKGLARLDPRDWTSPGSKGRIANVRSTDGLFDDGIHTILEDNFGRFWMSTNRGIFWVSRKELNDFADGRATRVRSTGYTERHGLSNREANGGMQPAGSRTADGRLWFATQDGVAMVDPATIGVRNAQPNVVIERVIAGGVPIAADTHGIEIGPDRRDLRMEFTALSFLAPENIRFRYRLSPYDKTWVDADTRRSATYTRVPPGNYTFEVIASTNGDVWSAHPASLSVAVTPRFVETGTFKLILLLGIALVAWAAVRFRVARLKKLAEDLQHRVDERTSQLREREALLAEKNAQLETQAGQLQELDKAKTRFFANVSHELRTPLTLTIGPLEDARAQLADTASHVALSRIDVALRNSRRLFRLVNQILDVSKLEGGATKLRAQAGDLSEFVRGIASAFDGVAERKQVVFNVEAPSDPLEVWYDADALEKILANLLSNAFKFTPDRGTINVSVDELGEKGMARVRISDSGPGIPAGHLSYIFDRFYQVDETNTRAQPGTGIGLSLARELAELHGGTIEVECATGDGALFTLLLPIGHAHLEPDQIVSEARADGNGVVDAEVASLPANGNGVQSARQTSEDVTTLLVVDDNADLRSYVRSRFESGYRIVEAADGADAIRLARQEIPDLIISDVMMPGTDGHALVAAIRENPETDFIPVILLTAQAAQNEKVAGLSLGADDYIVKPFDMRELEARVENLIASRRRLRERFSGLNANIKAIDDSASSADRAFVERLKTAVGTGVSDPDFGVGELAKAVFLDRSHLFRRTKELLNETPSDLLRRVRLERAALLLKESEGGVAEIAYACGFNSVSQFCRSFRVAYDATPSEYRVRNTAPTGLQHVR